MRLEIPGIAMAFEDLPIGSFFMFERSEREYGICVSDGRKRAAIILSTPERPNGHMPWLALGGLPNDAVVSFPAAILRGRPSDITADTGVYGSLISAGGGFYMRVGEATGNRYSFNVETGQIEKLPEGKMAIAYARWQVGIMIEERFEPIFSFPPTRSS